ncbi:hypothetical protein LPJ56_006071 [Coemansia sp. RSA 2599]|nr:hypothetical protein LPJ56_006071 [Coemansia sp. RSA 2599]
MAPRQKHTSAVAGSTNGVAQPSSRQGSSTAPAGSTPRNIRTQKYTQLDFNSLNIQVLRKYRQVFKLNIKARSSKDDLVVAATRHFSNHTVDEVDTIARFLYTVHSNKGKHRPLEQPAGLG